jgi:hypothetical protein
MNPLIWVGFSAFFIVALAVGIRLLVLAARTRELPELLMGIGVLGIGPVGFGLLVGASVAAASPLLQQFLLWIGTLAVASGVLAKYVFNWRVYHPQSAIARFVVIAAGVALFGSSFYSGITGGLVPQSTIAPLALLRNSLQIGCLLWGAAESLRYWSKMRLRLRLGLADPVVTNRFLMWAIGAFAAGFGTAVGTAAQVVTGKNTFEVGWVMASSSLHGLVAAVAIGLAFIPPASYRRWVRTRSEAAHPAADFAHVPAAQELQRSR